MLAALCASRGAVARAQDVPPPQVALAWSAPSECPDRADVLALVDRLHAPSPRRAATPSAAATVTRRDDGRWSLDLQTVAPDGVGERTLVADSCAQVAEAAALILVLALDGTTTAPPPAPAPSPPVMPRPASTPLRFAARLAFALDGGTLPAVAPGLGATVAMLRGRLRLELGATYLFPRRAVNAANVGGDIALLSVGLRGCALLRRGLVEPRLCGAVEGGAMMGSGVGLATPTSGASPWWGLFGSAAVAVNLSPHVSWHVAVDAGLSIASPDFVIGNVGEVHRPSQVLVRGASGIEWRF